MTAMRQFQSAIKAKTPPKEFKFIVDGVECTAYPPTDEQVIMVMAAQAGGLTTDEESIAAQINFTFGLFDTETHMLLGRKLLDREDDFDFTTLTEIMQWVLSEATGNPTTPQSGSSSSQEPTGGSSTVTAPLPESTPSKSLQGVSST